ncbi:MAG: hypothetical protein FWH25_02710 [Syntrophorhabdaceae bacterium]|nr:hypothetical protein [Syntrophorhabdaceae bacterium]
MARCQGSAGGAASGSPGAVALKSWFPRGYAAGAAGTGAIGLHWVPEGFHNYYARLWNFFDVSAVALIIAFLFCARLWNFFFDVSAVTQLWNFSFDVSTCAQLWNFSFDVAARLWNFFFDVSTYARLWNFSFDIGTYAWLWNFSFDVSTCAQLWNFSFDVSAVAFHIVLLSCAQFRAVALV